jgi:hypothetical protein
MPARRFLLLCLLLAGFYAALPVVAQEEGFGFGAEAEQAPAPALSLAGTVGVGSTVYVGDFAAPGSIDLGSLASASLDLKASGSLASAYLGLKLSRDRLESDPGSLIDTARVGLYLGSFSLESGLMKLAWGRADSGSPLDVLNPLDLTDLSIPNYLDRKLAMPMVHARLSFGQYSNLEAVLEPGFRGNRMALSGKWETAEMKTLLAGGHGYNEDSVAAVLAPVWTLDHSQAGARFTTSLGGFDLGAQYFYGYLADPVIYYPAPGTSTISYVRRHQAGLDFAAVLAGFSLRGEAAANLTADLDGSDPRVPNSSIAFLFGFSRSLAADFSIDLQYSGSLRLAAVSLADDVEYGKPPLSSTLTGTMSRTLLKGGLVISFAASWGVDDGGLLLSPSAVLNFGDGEMGLYGGFFGGSPTSRLGQYSAASYLRAGITYKF